MIRRFCLSLMIAPVVLLFSSSLVTAQKAEQDEKPEAEKRLFSGPQVGEKLPPLSAQAVFGEEQGKKLRRLERATT